jgi:hypothetical protein
MSDKPAAEITMPNDSDAGAPETVLSTEDTLSDDLTIQVYGAIDSGKSRFLSAESDPENTTLYGRMGSGKPSRCPTAEDIRRIWRSGGGGLVVLEIPPAADPQLPTKGSK